MGGVVGPASVGLFMREIAAAGLEHLVQMPQKPLAEQLGGAQSGALPADLVEVITTWPRLSVDVRAAVLSILRRTVR
jgi:hypothetical protein